MAKMSAARRRQLNRVRRLRKSLGERGYYLPSQAWELESISTQQLARMTPEWFYRHSEYQVSAKDYAAIINSGGYLGAMPGDIVPGTRGRQIERFRRSAKQDYTYTGRLWEIINTTLQSMPSDPIGAKAAANLLNKAISAAGIDIVEASIRAMPEEALANTRALSERDYNALSMEAALTGKRFNEILEPFYRALEDILMKWWGGY